METILTILVFLAISGLSTFLKKRSEEKERGGTPVPSPPSRGSGGNAGSPQPETGRSLTSSWEEELRRLLEGETPAEPSSAPPPIRPRPLPREAAPPVLMPEPMQQESFFETEPFVVDPNASKPFTTEFAKFQDADSAIAMARQVREQAARDLAGAKAISERKGYGLQPRRAISRSGEIAETMTLFRSPGAARRAVIASVVLGPPRALQSADPSLF